MLNTNKNIINLKTIIMERSNFIWCQKIILFDMSSNKCRCIAQ